MSASDRILLLDPGIGDDLLDDAFAELDLRLQNVIGPGPDQQMQRIYVSEDRQNLAYVIEHLQAPERYLVVSGNSAEGLEQAVLAQISFLQKECS